MSPKENYELDITKLSMLAAVSQDDKNIFAEAVKYQKEL